VQVQEAFVKAGAVGRVIGKVLEEQTVKVSVQVGVCNMYHNNRHIYTIYTH
jgi:hypothetical protein